MKLLLETMKSSYDKAPTKRTAVGGRLALNTSLPTQVTSAISSSSLSLPFVWHACSRLAVIEDGVGNALWNGVWGWSKERVAGTREFLAVSTFLNLSQNSRVPENHLSSRERYGDELPKALSTPRHTPQLSRMVPRHATCTR